MSSIHDKALDLAKRFRGLETDLIRVLEIIDYQKSFREKGFTSTFDYCVRFLNLSESNSYSFIAIARKSRQVPELRAAVEDEMVSVSKAKKIVSVITNENKDHWLKLAQTLSKGNLEKAVAKENPQLLTVEKVKYVSEDRLKLKLGISEELKNDLKRAQEIFSQKDKTHVSLEEMLQRLVKEFLIKEDPVAKAQRAAAKVQECSNNPGATSAKLVPGPVATPSFRRKPLNASLKHQIHFRDRGQCTYLDSNGQRCSERKWLHFHHIVPVGEGGQNRPENLTTLCFGHHRIVHQATPRLSGTFSRARVDTN